MNGPFLALALVAAALPTGLMAAGTHAGGHGHAAMAIGSPAESEPTRTIEIRMAETEDGRMIFEPASLDVSEGETVRLAITNTGALPHEFVMDTLPNVEEHKALMERFPEMEHDDPNAVHLEPGESGEILWTFAEAGTFQFACLIPGHYDAGMHGPLIVN
ncbi:cupredoxin domain-containing protein [Palleronia pelagia]|nr:cupredoxin family protein [Palleronia pelagia]